MDNPTTNLPAGIENTPGICGGDARIAGTRIPIWLLVAYRNHGLSEAELLNNYPGLTQADLSHAWDYAAMHAAEIAVAIRDNDNEV